MEKIKEILKRIGEMGGIAVVALYEVEEATAEIKTMATQLKDKDERIKELEAARKGYFTVLNDKLNRNNF